jgi:nucleotide-binding universal stress UspA family protein
MSSLKTPKDNVILVPTDFSQAADNALEHAVGIAKLFDNKIVLLYVLSDNFVNSIFGSKAQTDLTKEMIKTKLNEKIAAFKSAHPTVVIEKLLKEGKVYKNIIKASQEFECDSIVMGFNGLAQIEKSMGSTTSRVLKSSNVPVVIIKDQSASLSYSRIVLPIDLTRESKQKVKWAVHLAKKYSAEVHVIMEIESDKFLKKKVEANMIQVVKILSKEGINVIHKILDDQSYPGNFGSDIVKYSQEVDANLILIMTQKESEFKDFFVGSFAVRVINGTNKVPIMAINPVETSAGYYFD